MSIASRCIAAIIFAAFSLSAKAQTQTEYPPYYDYWLKQIIPGIFVSVREEPLRHFVEGNFTLIVNADHVIVVDAGGTPTAARKIIQDIRVKIGKPVRYLINTHFHGDHTFGNQEFVKNYPGIAIVGSAPTKEVMDGRVKTFVPYTKNEALVNARRERNDSLINVLLEQKPPPISVIDNLIRHRDDLRKIVSMYNEVVITPPTIVVEKEMTLGDSTRRPVKVLYLGPGDTPGDTWVFLPKEKILIAGDAVVHPVPYGFTKDPSGWIATLKKAAQLDFEIMIPGHGDVQHGKQYINRLITLLETIAAQVKAGAEKGNTLEQVRKDLDIAELEKAYTGDDELKTYYFNDYFKLPLVRTLYDIFKKKSQ